ncbi:MAG: hypothetical protein COA78_28270 [Blastopirellula sp.]|nr:MAG: hypothetical protein COA78_28270 [Blastopirellula sp.]
MESISSLGGCEKRNTEQDDALARYMDFRVVISVGSLLKKMIVNSLDTSVLIVHFPTDLVLHMITS